MIDRLIAAIVGAGVLVHCSGDCSTQLCEEAALVNLNQVTMPAVDMAQSTRFYRAMGFLQIVDTSHYARFECPHGDSTFSLSLQSESSGSSTTVYFEHEQLDQWVTELLAKGFEFDQLPTDQTYLWREAVLHDPAGNKLKLYFAGVARKFPPWRDERRQP